MAQPYMYPLGLSRVTDLWDLPSDPQAHDRLFDGN
jgi:hypothetical protein